MTTEQREVLDAIHVAWKANPELTFPELITKAFHEPLVKEEGLSEDWDLMTNQEACTVLLELGKVEFVCPSCNTTLDFIPNDFNCCKCGYSNVERELKESKRIQTENDIATREARKVLQEVVCWSRDQSPLPREVFDKVVKAAMELSRCGF